MALTRNLAHEPACTLSLRLDGIDLTLEGEARRVTDGPTLESVAAVFREGGWPAEVEGDAIGASGRGRTRGLPRAFRLAGTWNSGRPRR